MKFMYISSGALYIVWEYEKRVVPLSADILY
jgi:hypothetical protein